MREPILKAVAAPPKILWAPFVPVILNIGVQFPFMFAAIGTFEANPLIFVVTIAIVHLGIIIWANKEPHISNMMQAFGQCYHFTKNIYKVKGKKFAP